MKTVAAAQLIGLAATAADTMSVGQKRELMLLRRCRGVY